MHGYRRVPANFDKPHRCPKCHTVRFRGTKARFARPKVVCHPCLVWWRYPMRVFG